MPPACSQAFRRCDDQHRTESKPGARQGVKLELFIFDSFPLAERCALLEVRREDEFAPVKNAPGAAADSPDTARRATLALHTRRAAPRPTLDPIPVLGRGLAANGRPLP